MSPGTASRRRSRARLRHAGAGRDGHRRRRLGLIEWLGRRTDHLLRRLGVVAPETERSPDADRLRGFTILLVVGVVGWAPTLAIVVGVVGWHVPVLVHARDDRRHLRAVREEVILAVELLAVSAHAGSSVVQAIGAVAPHLAGSVGSALGEVASATSNGVGIDEALASSGARFGDAVVPHTSLLRAAHLDGDPLAPGLDRLGDRLRAEQRVRSEAEARRLSARLVLPLVCCILPGFVLVGLAPVVVDAIRSGLG